MKNSKASPAGPSGPRSKDSGTSRTAGESGARATKKNVALDNRSNTAGPGPALHNGRELPSSVKSSDLFSEVGDLSPSRGKKK